MNLALQKRHEQLERWRKNEEQENENYEINASNRRLQADDCTQPSASSSAASGSQTTTATTKCPSKDSLQRHSKESSSSKNRLVDSTNKSHRSEQHLTQRQQVKFTNSTLFLSACANGDLSECERLLSDNLVDVNATTCDGLTGLHEAAICGNAEMVEYLLEQREVNINCCDNEGWTPLHAAASLGQTKIVELLLEGGADVTIINCENFLAYDLARNDQIRELIGEKLKEFDIEQLRSQEEQLIESDIRRWIKTGQCDERSHPVTNATVLHVIAAKGYVNLLRLILDNSKLKKQINLEAKDNEGYTPLLAASFWNQSEIVELLIESGANIFAQANNGYKISSIVSICGESVSRHSCPSCGCGFDDNTLSGATCAAA